MTKSSFNSINKVSDTANAVAAWAVPEPGEFDVICAKGGKANNHKGNKLYLRDRDMLRESYLRTNKRREKNSITEELVNGVHERGGQFRVCCPRTKLWMILDPVRTHTKAGQALRECFTPEERKQKRDRYKKGKAEGYSSSSSEEDDSTMDASIDNSRVRKHERSSAPSAPPAKRIKRTTRSTAGGESIRTENRHHVDQVSPDARSTSDRRVECVNALSVVTEDDEDGCMMALERNGVGHVHSDKDLLFRSRPSLYRNQSGSSEGAFILEFDPACVEILMEALVEETQGSEKVTADFENGKGLFSANFSREEVNRDETCQDPRWAVRDYGFGKTTIPSLIIYEV